MLLGGKAAGEANRRLKAGATEVTGENRPRSGQLQ